MAAKSDTPRTNTSAPSGSATAGTEREPSQEPDAIRRISRKRKSKRLFWGPLISVSAIKPRSLKIAGLPWLKLPILWSWNERQRNCPKNAKPRRNGFASVWRRTRISRSIKTHTPKNMGHWRKDTQNIKSNLTPPTWKSAGGIFAKARSRFSWTNLPRARNWSRNLAPGCGTRSLTP